MMSRKDYMAKSQTRTSVSLIQWKVLVDFIVTHVDGDKRTYLEITVFGYSMLDLLDSSSITLVWKAGLLGLEMELDTSNLHCSKSWWLVPTL